MPIVQNRFYNDPALGAAFQNLAGMFAPPSGSDAAGYATAGAKRQEAERLAALFDYAQSPNFDQTTFDRMGMGALGWTPTQSFYSVDQGNLTTRRGQDIGAQTSLSNNAADNERALEIAILGDATDRRGQDIGSSTSLANNAADNARALEIALFGDATTRRGQDVSAHTSITNNTADNSRAMEVARMDEAGELARFLAQPIIAGENDVVRLPDQTAAATGLPAMFSGNISADPGEQITTPDGRLISGAPKPMSESEMIAHILGGLPQAEQRLAALSDVSVEEIVTEEGPRFSSRIDAIGQEPAPSSPSTVVHLGPDGIDYGEPESGLAWARNEDGTVKLDERGAPIALPYQGGSVFTEQQTSEDQAGARDAQAAKYADIVTEEVDRAVATIREAPHTSTGMGSQLFSGIGGSTARDVAKLVETIKANIGFDRLQELRNNSPTGGALGPVSDFENQLLQATIGSLDLAQSSDQVIYNLHRVKAIYEQIIHRGIQPGDPITEATGPEDAAVETPAQEGFADGTIIENDAGERMIRRGGRWEPL